MPEFLTISDIARRLSCSHSLIRQEVERGAFPGAFSIGTRKRHYWRIPESGYHAYVAKHRPAMTPQPQIDTGPSIDFIRQQSAKLRRKSRKGPAATGQPHSPLG